MLAIAFTFPAGRYHATPWGRHVNEADVAWPPDLWRIVRALIAVWHRKLDPNRFPRVQLSEMLARLASADPPSFRLPEIAIHAHTRHYMPGKSDKRTLIFDAFARVAHDDPIVIGWRSLQLANHQIELLDALLDNLAFLGRAESWVEARRVVGMPEFNCFPAGEAEDIAIGEAKTDLVRLLAPASPEDYSRFCTERRIEAGVAGDRARPPKLNAAQKKLIATLPLDWLDALSVGTNELQAAGWSSPPAAGSVNYVRPAHALRTIAPKRSARPRSSRANAPTTARYVVYGKPLPRIEDALRIGEALRAATMGQAKRTLGHDRLPAELSGHDLDEGNRHGHAFWLPEAAKGLKPGSACSGLIDHLLVHVPNGLSSDSVRVLTALQWVKRDQGDSLRVMLEGIGEVETLASASAYAQCARTWRSVTPYLHPWYIKKAALRSEAAILAAVEDQLRREWALRGNAQPAIESIELLADTTIGGRRLLPLHFHRFRRKRGLSQPDTLGRMLELRFSAPVRGPVALGFGCHFGLGMFMPSST